MAQRKKPQIREAILAAAFRLFSSKGYAATMVADIAREAGVSPGNVYIYFHSKLEILYAIYDPWLRARVDALVGNAGVTGPAPALSAIFFSRSRTSRSAACTLG